MLTESPRGERVDPAELELSLLSLFVGWSLAEEIQGRLASEGFGDVRFADGFIFQRLLAAGSTVGDLAEALGVTQQAASKAVADLEARGYVRREVDPGDRRARRVTLTQRGRDVVGAARRHRAAVERELEERFGSARVAAARELLAEVLAWRDTDFAVRGRRVRPPR
ncbi:MAG TPA: MarR family transcriptional regulator [Solirubrobacterales bacterium]|jgi:DNA-binding MarR family transcriptional regulator